MDTEIFFGALGLVLGVLSIALPIWLERRRHGLRWATIDPKSMLEVAEEIASDVKISYQGRAISDLTRFNFILHNTGRLPIGADEIVGPLTWSAPGPILSSRVIASAPPVALQLNPEGKDLEISWSLFNPRCMALIEVLCETSTLDDSGKVSAQIRNVTTIEEKKISGWDEMEAIRALQNAWQLSAPRWFPKFLFGASPRMMQWLIRVNKWFFAVYIALLPAIFVTIFVDELKAPKWTYALGPFFSVLLLGFFLFLGHSPYKHLLSNIKSSRQHASSSVSIDPSS
jgi:hypothetical protein